MPFLSLGLIPTLVQAAAAQGFSQPTPVQTLAIPAILAGSDLLAAAQTGSGKTAAYALPVLQRLSQVPADSRPSTYARAITALILVPTRELAVQVGDVLRALAQTLPRPLKVAVVFGGVSINPQMMALRGGADVGCYVLARA